MKQGIGASMVVAGVVIGGLNYLLTAFVFFSRGDTLLGFIQLVVIPAELVLPWVAHPLLGAVSSVGLGLMILGSRLTDD